MLEIISDEQLGELVYPNAKWIFVKTNRNNVDSSAKSYFSDVKPFTEDSMINAISGRFIEAQPLDWFQKFYEWLAQTADRISVAKFKPFFLDDDGRATAAFDRQGTPIIFLPDDSLPANVDYPKVHRDLLANAAVEKFLTQEIGIREPELKDIDITKNFIEAQPPAWFEKFYEWLAQSSNRIFAAKVKPFFLDDNGKATAAFDGQGKPLLFLPNQIDYPTVHPALLANPAVKKFLTEKIGIREPELKDVVAKILQRYENEPVTDDAQYFKEIFRYYNQCPNAEIYNYIQELKNVIHFRKLDGKFSRPNDLYFPTTELTEYFSAANLQPFLDENFYLQLVGAGNADKLREFFKGLGVADEVRYLPIKFNDAQARKLQARGFELPFPHTNHTRTWYEKTIHGSMEICDSILKTHDEQKSFLLWRRMVAVNQNVGALEKNLRGHCDYFYHTEKSEGYTPVNVQLLKNSAWLVDKAGNFKKPADMTVGDMANDSNDYDLTSASAKQLIDFLGIPSGRLTVDEQRQIDIGKKLEEAGFTAAEIQKLIDAKKNPQPQPSPQPNPTKVSPKKISPTTPPPADEESDADELAPAAVDYRKKLERAQKKRDDEQNQIARLEELQQKVLSAEKYSFAWLKSLLELEILNSREKNSNSKEISISFGRVSFDTGTRRTLILEQPRSYIPQFMEELENISLVLHTAASATTVEIEVAAVRNYTLRVKLKDNYKLDEMNLDEVVEATISAKNPVFLLEELQNQIDALAFADDYNLRDNLCANIEFVFGPPGTGKTYTLAKKIIGLMSERGDKKILVLTPTNKAADVLVKKIMELDDAKAYKDWLLRFGTTKDDDVEKSGVFKDKTFDISAARRNVTATTIVRFPYDFFMTGDKRIFLREIHWDYIIIDEASMIMLAQILLPLYKKTPRKFIVAGDPFQIPPVTAIDLWKDENIYTLVGLKSFVAPQTFPHDYPVECLTTQYRSVPAVGEIFSRFAYDGILKHNRAAETQRPLHIDDWLDVESLNIIKFPVKKYESIYRSRRLNGTSSYQIYSALFTFEFVKELSRRLEKNNPDENFSVGIVAPYRAQADVIEKLFAAAEHFERVDVQVGTVHIFQGDECDILFAVFNTPPAISASPEMFLNRLNIINVAISRARDYLFLVMPDDETENVGNLHLVKKVERFFADENGVEFAAQEIEESMFGQRNYIEENSFATGHQNVNVYTLPERHYEIRSEDTAVDVQVH
ncbi:MAG: DNA2/NAM7 family helicase [Selenomonadaceae bacterium]|nr:DNA2/NAM7 family helicase [Selenomonadaceae bacterium]